MGYGQTSSGKTYTIVGGDEVEERGVIPRFAEDLFKMKQEMPANRFTVLCSFFEIYNELIYDLMDDGKAPLALRENPKDGFFVDNLIEVNVNSFDELNKAFRDGMLKRRTAETGFNQRSSRSHGIFTIKIESSVLLSDSPVSEELTEQSVPLESKLSIKKRCVLHFVDLAGSERHLEQDSIFLKETCQINKSLVVLSKAISSLNDSSKRYAHFRDSK